MEQISLYPILETPTDQALAKSVYRSLEETVSSTFRRLITYSFLTCLPQRERTMFDLIFTRPCPRTLPTTGSSCSPGPSST